MAGSTTFYGMGFFDFGEDLASPLSIALERERFVLIDRQLYAYFSVFGDGVISGWEITENGTLDVGISPGVGIVNGYAIESVFADAITNISPNTTGFIYAQVDSSSIIDKNVNFVFSITSLTDNALLLASITTSGSSITSIDTTVRQKIGFKDIIDQAISEHRHDGVTAPRVDLEWEVQGELPMSRIEDFDASKISSGEKLPTSVLPSIDHTKLKNVGTLTHAQLDSFAQSIQKDNIALFGEVTTINLMKLALALKYQNPNIDQFFENMLLMIPGISPEEFIDLENTNAIINRESNCVSGKPVIISELGVVGTPNEDGADVDVLQIVSVPWQTDQDFRLASSYSNVTISDGIQLSTDTTAARLIESFDEGINGVENTSYSNELRMTNSIAVKFDINAAEGPLAGRFEISQSREGVFRRNFSNSQDWSSYDTLNVLVQASNASHASVTITLYNSENSEITTFLLLGTDEVTTFADEQVNGFVNKSFSIAGYERADVAAIEFTTDKITNEDEFFLIDTISVSSKEFLLPLGNIKFRYNTTNSVLFNTIDYDAIIPSGTEIRLRAKVANSLEELSAAPYTSLLASGEAFGLTGTHIEIDINLIADETLKKTPLIESVILSILVPAKQSGLSIATAEDWLNGTRNNIAVSDAGVISMDKTNVGNIYFLSGINVNELDTSLIPVAGVASDNMPIAPYQGYVAINPDAQVVDEYNPGREFLRGLYRPRSVYRLKSGNFLVADTGNDRIMEFTQSGVFIRGYASHNDTYDDLLYALTSNYNPRIGVLFITFSRDVDVKFADLTTITLNVNGQDIRLSNSVDLVRNVGTGEIIERPELEDFLDGSAGNFEGLASNILSIILSDDKQKIIADNSTNTIRVRIDGNPSPATTATVLPGDIGGLECFVGDYMYFGNGGIWRPVHVIETEESRFLYLNAILNYDKDELAPDGVGSIIEFEKAIGSEISGQSLGATFTSNEAYFSDIMIGSALYFKTYTSDGQEERKLLIAGLSKNGTSISSSSSGGSDSIGISESQKLSQFVGKVMIINMGSDLVEWSYTSPDGSFPSDAYFDDDGNIVIAESSIFSQSGRIVTVDSYGTVINLIEGGLYTKIWDIRKLPGGNIFVST